MPEPRPFKRYAITAERVVREKYRLVIEARNSYEAAAIARTRVEPMMLDAVPEMDMIGHTVNFDGHIRVEEE